jgi:hypothetical protein
VFFCSIKQENRKRVRREYQIVSHLLAKKGVANLVGCSVASTAQIVKGR